MKLVECQNIKMAYDGQIAVRDVSFSVYEGDYLYILGENGSGKTTLMKGLLGLMQPLSGDITFKGLAQSEIGYLPQQTQVQRDFPASVWEIVISGCLNQRGFRPFYSPNDKKRVSKYLSLLGLTSLQKRSYRELSGGQQQRVLLARALCAANKLLILDEPVTGLDPVATSDFYSLLDLLNVEERMTIIMVSHDMMSAVRYGKNILHMDTGLLYYGPTSDYMTTETYRKMMGNKDHD